jgi:ornithine decarboxylase
MYDLENLFFICNLDEIIRFFEAWIKLMPRITPFYAVKCHLNSAMVSTLACLGTGFDCASANEIEQVIDLGISPDRIIYANPSKLASDLRYASKVKVQVSTYDTVSELDKVLRYYPELRLILRLRSDDPSATCHLGNKFGSEPESWKFLINAAIEKGVHVIGAAFHVGSNSKSNEAFNQAICNARLVFELGKKCGFPMHLIDIGGGFTTRLSRKGEVLLNSTSENLAKVLEQFFPASENYNIISEPGRFFVEKACRMMTQVFSKRVKFFPDEQHEIQYWISDGLYGSMNCLIYDHAILKPCLLKTIKQDEEIYSSTIFGPTCDGLDTVIRTIMFPFMSVQDWIGFRDMGAYTLSGACEFNGMDVCSPKFIYARDRK